MRKVVVLFILFSITFLRLSSKCISLDIPLHLSSVDSVCEGGGEDKDISIDFLDKLRHKIIINVKEVIPSPHAELILGMTIGYNGLKEIPRFNDVVIDAGTIHVIVVSGYNINLVFSFISRFIGSKYRLRNLLIMEVFAVIYSIFTGFDPPVVRALIMSSIFIWISFYGRKSDVIYVFVITGLSMIIYNPKYLFSISFQLSSLATLGLILFVDIVEGICKYVPFFTLAPKIIKADLVTTVAAQILVSPLIAFYFGRLSIVSIITNSLSLWTIPYITLCGYIVVITSLFSTFFTKLSYILILPLSHLFVSINEFFAQLNRASVDVSIGLKGLLISFVLPIGIYFVYISNKKSNYIYKDTICQII